jgi:hypothetical protein
MTGAAELSFVAPQRQIKRHLAKSRQETGLSFGH